MILSRMPTPSEIEAAAGELAHAHPTEILRWGTERLGERLVLACSFQAEDLVLIDMLCRLVPRPRAFYLDTGLLFPETYATCERVLRRYPVEMTRVEPRLTVEQQAQAYGPRLWERDPDLCCALRKIEPLERALAGELGWITGIRREQAPTRANTPVIQWDSRFGLVKLNPLAAWTWEQVWSYIIEHNVPYNPLYDRGFTSIGCWPCTTAVAPGEHPRAGRWRGKGKVECGLHDPVGRGGK